MLEIEAEYATECEGPYQVTLQARVPQMKASARDEQRDRDDHPAECGLLDSGMVMNQDQRWDRRGPEDYSGGLRFTTEAVPHPVQGCYGKQRGRQRTVSEIQVEQPIVNDRNRTQRDPAKPELKKRECKCRPNNRDERIGGDEP